MSNFKKWFLYFVDIAAVTAFFLYYLFPSDAVKKYIALKVSKANPDISIKIDRIKPAFPPGLKFDGIDVLFQQNPLVELEDLKIVPNPISFFRPEITFSFKGRLYEGLLKGNGNITKPDAGKPLQLSINAELTEIQIKNINAIKKQSQYKASGILNGNVTYKTKEPEPLVSKLAVSDCNVEITIPFINLEKFVFKTIDADITMDKNKKILIKQFTAKGLQLNGDASGNISLRTPSDKSVLNLSGNLKPHPSFIASMGKMASVVFKKSLNRVGENGVPFTIRGTFEKPDFSFR